MLKRIKKFFKIEQHNTTIGRELIAGLTTFLAMAYILVVNAGILGDAGMNPNAVLMATAISAGAATIVMGLYAKYPIGLAPGMGVNAFFTYTVVFGMGYTWQMALAAVFVSGILFLGISLTGIREKVINAIPKDLKTAIGVGIGFFIAFIGLKNAGIVVIDIGPFAPGIPQLGGFNPPVLLFVFGLLLTTALHTLKVKASVFWGLVGTFAAGVVLGYFGVSGMPFISTGAEFSFAPLKETFGQAIIALPDLFKEGLGALVVVFSFLFMDFFDTAGTLIATGEQAGLLNEKGELDDSGKALIADSGGTIVGSIFGTSTVTAYIESGAGIAAGGRTGLTAVTTGVLFLLATFLWPFLGGITNAVTAPALVMVGILMAMNVKNINWNSFPVATTSFLTIIMMVLTYSIAEGIATGFIIYPILMVFDKKAKQVHPVMYGLMLLFIAYFIFL